MTTPKDREDTLKHLDFVINQICGTKMTDKPTRVLSSEESTLVSLDILEGAQTLRCAQRAREYQTEPVVYGN